MDEQLGDPTTHDVDTLVNDPERMALVRLRLSDVSWFMRALSELRSHPSEGSKNIGNIGNIGATHLLNFGGLVAIFCGQEK